MKRVLLLVVILSILVLCFLLILMLGLLRVSRRADNGEEEIIKIMLQEPQDSKIPEQEITLNV